MLSVDLNFVNGTFIIIADISFYGVICKQIPLTAVTSVIDGLKKLYIEKLKPLEVTYKFNDFVSPLLVHTVFPVSGYLMKHKLVLSCVFLCHHYCLFLVILFKITPFHAEQR